MTNSLKSTTKMKLLRKVECVWAFFYNYDNEQCESKMVL